ncbi:MAG: NTPase [Dissulfurispiraceae bacterium]
MICIKKNILITGLPGSGKTTLIRRLSAGLMNNNPAGFYTGEIREKGVREGFELISLEGGKALLASVHIESPFRVGKYGVDIRGFEEFLKCIPFPGDKTGLVIIDEIGKMECLSDSFRRLMRKLLDADTPLIATIALKGGGITEEIKERNDVEIFEITHQNRDSISSEILRKVKAIIEQCHD